MKSYWLLKQVGALKGRFSNQGLYWRETQHAYDIYTWKKRPFDRARQRWEDNTKTNFEETVCVDTIHRTQDTDQWQNLVGSIKDAEFL
jgi:hypothetical protein